MALNRNAYPENIFEPLTPYVYFDDLDDEILNIIAKEFSTNLTDMISPETNTNSINDALMFLQ